MIGKGKPKANDQEKPGCSNIATTTCDTPRGDDKWKEPSTSFATETEQSCGNDFVSIFS